jgi:hypothetical protein
MDIRVLTSLLLVAHARAVDHAEFASSKITLCSHVVIYHDKGAMWHCSDDAMLPLVNANVELHSEPLRQLCLLLRRAQC